MEREVSTRSVDSFSRNKIGTILENLVTGYWYITYLDDPKCAAFLQVR